MMSKLLQFEVFYQLKQRAFPLFAVLFFLLGLFLGQQGFAPKGVNFNATYQVYLYTSLFTLGSVFIIMFFSISAMLRDTQNMMEGIIFSTSIKKQHYFWSRFSGTFLFSVLAFSPFVIGYIFGNYFFGLDPGRIADFKLMTYLQPWLFIVVPNIFICSAVIFSVCTLSKNNIATYASAVFIYSLYFICSIFLNSPIIAQAVPASPESMTMASIADPFGIAAFLEQTQFWTPYQKNTQLLSLSGLFLWNRIIWILISSGLLFLTYTLFSFRKLSKKAKKEKTKKEKTVAKKVYSALPITTNSQAQTSAFFALLKLELKGVFKSLPFIAVLIMWSLIVFFNLYSTVVSGGEYGVSVYPVTSELIGLMVEPLPFFSLIVILFYSAEIVWKERSFHFNLIIDATPIKNSIFFLSKFTALVFLPLILITIGIIMCIVFQIALGYSNIEFGVYASLYYYQGLEFIVFSMLALSISSFSKTKFMGMGIFGLFAVLSLKARIIGLEHPLTSIGFLPKISYTNMNGFYGGVLKYQHLSVYWLAFGLLVIFLTFKVWNRGLVTSFRVKLKQVRVNWTVKQRLSLVVLSLLFIGFGGLVFYNTNVVSDYTTMEDQLEVKAQYEKRYKKYETLKRLSIASRKTEVAMYPKKRKYTVKANYYLKNSNNTPISELFITEKIPLQDISIEKGTLVQYDSIIGSYLFKFDKAIPSGDSISFQFNVNYDLKGYEESKTIISNGSYITHRDFEPILGYHSGFEIIQKEERIKRELPIRVKQEYTDTHMEMQEFTMEKVYFETVVSTSADQIALSSGELIREWTTNNRKYYHYKTQKPVSPMLAYFSANYEKKTANHNGISIEQYFDQEHHENSKHIEWSTKTTLDYCQTNFGAYPFDYIRIAEVPAHWGFGGFAHPGMISMVENRLYLNNVSDPNTFNLVAKRTIHEISHQWWGHTLTGKPIAGGSLLVEGFAKYTEAVVMEKMYGKKAVYALVEDARRKYFNHRSYASQAEPPVYKVLGQNYISYGKALHVMLALRDLIGETTVNRVLKSLTDKFRHSAKLKATTLDFLNEVYAHTPVQQQELVNDWFKKVITYDLAVDASSNYTKLPNGTFEVIVKINAKRFETLDTGEIIPISINEPIKIGVFTTHPSLVEDDSSIVYYASNLIDKEQTEIKLVVNQKPSFIAIDPYGTRSDANIVDNVKRLEIK